MLSELFIQELKNSNEIEQVISSYVKLRRRGRVANGLCPFHSEKSPSFTVYPENQSFYCFGCGAGGDVITFIRRIENLEYIEALRFLAQRAGIQLPENGEEDAAMKLKSRVYELNRTLARFYHDCLKHPSGKTGLDYLHARGLSNKTITGFGLGYSPNAWNDTQQYLHGKGFTEQEMLAAAVIAKSQKGSYYDQFRNRVIFPIMDLRGNVIGFGGRAMGDDKGPKYLNSADTPVFKKSRGLFALNFAKNAKQQELLLCEGYMDVISVHQAGFTNAVATLGTALTSEQARLIAQYASAVTIAYDSDGAGQTATRRAVGLLGETGVRIRVLSMKDAKDPDEYIKKFGAERFRLLIEGASNATEFEIAKLRQKYDMDTADGKVNFLKDFVLLLTTVQNPLERDVYVSKTANELGVDKTAIFNQYEFEKKRKHKKQQGGEPLRVFSEMPQKSGEGKTVDYQRSRNIKYALAEDKLLGILLKNPDYYSDAAAMITPEDFITDRNRTLAEMIFARLADGLSVEMAALGAYLSVEQMGIVASLLQSVSGLTFTRQELAEYSKVILSYKQQKSQDEVATMADDDYNAYIASIARKKK